MADTKTRAGWLIGIFWITALVFGSLHQSPWFLVIPPIVLLAERSLALWESAARLRETGARTADYYGQMTLPTLVIALWNGGICAVLFGVGWLVSSLVA
jgi:hypothetical protein